MLLVKTRRVNDISALVLEIQNRVQLCNEAFCVLFVRMCSSFFPAFVEVLCLGGFLSKQATAVSIIFCQFPFCYNHIALSKVHPIYTSPVTSTARMFILISLFILGLSIITGWIWIVCLAVLFNLPVIIYGIFIAAALIVITSFILFCTWLGFKVLKVVLRWAANEISDLMSAIWSLARGIFGFICWVFGRREEKVPMKSSEGVRLEDSPGKRQSGL